MTDADRALWRKLYDGVAVPFEQGMAAAMIENIEARVGVQRAGWWSACARWRHAGRTIRRMREWLRMGEETTEVIVSMMHRYRRRWQWEKRRADGHAYNAAGRLEWAQQAEAELAEADAELAALRARYPREPKEEGK